MYYRIIFNYAFQGFDQLVRSQLIDMLKNKKPVIQTGPTTSYMGFDHTPGHYLLLSDNPQTQPANCVAITPSPLHTSTFHVQTLNVAVQVHCASFQVQPLRVPLQTVYSILRAFYFKCALEHFRLLSVIPIEEGEEMFGPLMSFSPSNAKLINGAVDFRWYRDQYEKKLIQRTISGEYGPGDLISMGRYPFEYDKLPSYVKWLVLERNGDTALLLSLYGVKKVRFTKEEIASEDTVYNVLDDLYKNYYKALFSTYPEDPRILPLNDGRKISLLSVNDIKRLDIDDKQLVSAVFPPYILGLPVYTYGIQPWLLLGRNDRGDAQAFFKKDNYGVSVLDSFYNKKTFALRPIIRISCSKASEEFYR